VTYAPESTEYAAFEAIAEAFVGQREDLVVNVVPVPWDDIAPFGARITQLALAQQEGQGPDVWGPVPHNWTTSFASSGLARALETAQIDELSQYPDLALRACQVKGQQFGLPVLMDSVALIYNLEQVSEPPESFDALLSLARDLTDPERDRWGLAMPLLSQYHTYPFVDGYGGYLFACDAEECDVGDLGLNSEGAVRGIQYLSDMYVQGGLFPESLADRAVMHRYALQLFTEGRAAMLIDGPWVLHEVRSSEVAYGVALIPILPDATHAPRPLTVVQAVYASSSSAYPDETLALLNHIVGVDSAIAMQQVLLRTPVRRDVLRREPLRGDQEVRAWYDQALMGTLLPSVPELGYVWTPWGQALDRAIPGLMPVQDALDQAAEQIEGYLVDEQPDG
jgi:maltose-binding protein MalE